MLLVSISAAQTANKMSYLSSLGSAARSPGRLSWGICTGLRRPRCGAGHPECSFGVSWGRTEHNAFLRKRWHLPVPTPQMPAQSSASDSPGIVLYW